MVTVTQALDGSLMLKSHYLYGERLKALPGAHWNPDAKVWTIGLTALETLKQRFEGELYFKTPLWVIEGSSMPDMSAMYKVSDVQLKPLCHPYTLFNYQSFGVKFALDRINKHGFCIISDGVGLGKTNQGISVMQELGCTGVNLIICKKSIKYQWESEIRKFSPAFQKPYPIAVTGSTPKKRQEAYDKIRNAGHGILITNYQTFLNKKDLAEIASLNPNLVIIDEAHVVSGYRTKTNSAIAQVVRNKKTLFLTGTPIQSRPEQVYGIISLAAPDYFRMNFTQFKNKYVVSYSNGSYTATIGAKNLDSLRKSIQDVMIRRTEYEVAVELPDTVEQNITCPMDATQKKMMAEILKKTEEYNNDYAEHMKAHAKAIADGNYAKASKEFDLMHASEACAKGLIAARQACADDPAMFHDTKSNFLKKSFEHFIPQSYKTSSKIDATVEKVSDIIDSGEKVIIFSKFVTSAMVLSREIKAATGTVPVHYTGLQNEAQREASVKAFREDPNTHVMIASDAGCEGLNLQISKNLINFNLPDTAAIYTQRIGRVRRVGSAFKQVYVYNMITEGSNDESRWENIQRTKTMEDTFISIDEAQRQALKEAMGQ